jgi:hypothetical protein
MTKSQEIKVKLEEGATPKELIKYGYKPGLVYKVNRQVKDNTMDCKALSSNQQQADITIENSSLESEPEVIALKKAIRVAELKKKLTEINAPLEIELRMQTLEEKVVALEVGIDQLFDSIIDIQTILNNPPMSEIYHEHQCYCGQKGIWAIKAQCPKCGRDYLYKNSL